MAGPDTIAALATAQGTGGIAIIRISGKEAGNVLSRVFIPARKKPPAASSSLSDEGSGPPPSLPLTPRFMHYGTIAAPGGEPIDDVLAVYMPGPHSSTGEDVAEIHCHGGMAISRTILDLVFAAGATPAGPGEFTRRAFLNGKIDLTQAEAVAEAIAAPTLEGARLARAKLEGALGASVAGLRALLDNLRVLVTVTVDFDEEADAAFVAQFTAKTDESLYRINCLLASYDRARLWREGAAAVLAGQVNAGKSSLLNALLGRERAIVSPSPGTTRDYLEETVQVHGLPLRVTDTAGLRTGGDCIEEEGIRRAEQLCQEADILLLVVDALRGAGEADKAFVERHSAKATAGRLLVLLNKMDALPPEQCQETVQAAQALLPPGTGDILPVSAKQGDGLDGLCARLRDTLTQGQTGGDTAPNARQHRLLSLAGEELVALKSDLAAGLPPDILGVRLDTAVQYCDEITGASTSDEILATVFSSFCIGK